MNTNNLGLILLKGRKKISHKILEVASCSFEMSRLQALIWYIVVLVTLLVWVPLKLGYFLSHCCSTIREMFVKLITIRTWASLGVWNWKRF